MVLFEVKYYTCGSNTHPYFSTCAEEFIRNKRDYKRCGQCQDSVLPKNSVAMNFYKKWDCVHIKDITEEQYLEIIQDIEALKTKYNYLEKIQNEDEKFNENFSFYDEVEFSKQTLKK